MLEIERAAQKDKLVFLELARKKLTETFDHLSLFSQALKQNNEEFIKFVQENLKQFQNKTHRELT